MKIATPTEQKCAYLLHKKNIPPDLGHETTHVAYRLSSVNCDETAVFYKLFTTTFCLN